MGILDNLEGAWEKDFQFESKPIIDTDAMGRDLYWNSEGLALKIFQETCCSDCSCKTTN